jgi:hypothetical protein
LKEYKWELDETLNNYPPGKKIKVYYQIDKPEEGFLFARRIYSPFRFILFVSVIMCVFTYHRKSENEKHGFYVCLGLCIYWMLAGLICYGYYFYYVERPYKAGVIIRCIIYFLLGVVFLFYLFKPILFGSSKVEEQER